MSGVKLFQIPVFLNLWTVLRLKVDTHRHEVSIDATFLSSMIPKVNGSSRMSVKLKYFESGSNLAQVFVFFTLRAVDSKGGILMFDNTDSIVFLTVIWQYLEMLMTVNCCGYCHQHQ